MGLDRRTFLQRLGLGMLTLGVSETGLSGFNSHQTVSKINRYYQTLAAPTPRKLALLVGINNYADHEALKGCITDVELQQELLLYRFGFQQEDLLILTGREATREAIETAFVEHLIKQAQTGDVVIFHFSGYGTQVKVPQSENNSDNSSYKLVNGLIPSDGILPSKKVSAINDLLLDTLLLLGRSLLTDKVTFVLDTSYRNSDKTIQGNLRSRSFSTLTEGFNPEEFAFAEELKRKMKEQNRTNGNKPFPGVILSAAGKDQIATEILGDGWSAGLFTYLLTQYLWEVTPASKLIISLSQTTAKMEQIRGQKQIPTLISNGKIDRLTYNLMPNTLTGAEGVITKVEENNIQVKLTGLPLSVIDNYGVNSCFKVVPISPSNEPNQAETILQITARLGLTATVKPLSLSTSLQVGQQIQEWLRIIPHNLKLVVALAKSLEKIERVDATSAFSAIKTVSSVINAGDSLADCLLGKVNICEKNAENAAQFGGYGLFSPGGNLIPNTVGSVNEAVKLAVQRLTPHLQTLLAIKLWKLTLNEASSGLECSASLEKIAQTPQTLIRRNTRQVANIACGGQNAVSYLSKLSSCPQGLSPSFLSESNSNIPDIEHLLKLPLGTPIQYRLENSSSSPIYYLILSVDGSGNPMAFSPTQNQLLSGQTLILPDPSSDITWKISAPVGLVQVFFVVSVSPFEKTLQALDALESIKPRQEQPFPLSNPLEVTLALLQDLQTAGSAKINLTGTSDDSYVLDVNTWATFSFIYQVVE